MTPFRAAAVLLALLLLPLGARAESKTVEQISLEYFAVLQSDGMEAIPRFLHPDALAEFKTMLLPIFEYEAEAGRRELVNATFGSSVSYADIAAMDPERFAEGLFGLIMRQVAEMNLVFDRIEIVGVVEEGEARHVLSRITVGAAPLEVTQFEVLSYLPYKDTWRLQLNGQMRGFAQALRAASSGR